MVRWVEAYLALFLYIILLIIGLIRFKSLSKELKLFLFFIIFIILTDLTLFFLAAKRINNLWLIHFYTLFEFIILSFLFSYWQKTKYVIYGLRFSIFIFALIWIVAKIVLENFSRFDNFTASFSSIILMCFAIITLINLIKEPTFNILREPKFWVSSGILIYFGGNFFSFALSTVITVWSLHDVINIIANLFYAGGFLSSRN